MHFRTTLLHDRKSETDELRDGKSYYQTNFSRSLLYARAQYNPSGLETREYLVPECKYHLTIGINENL